MTKKYYRPIKRHCPEPIAAGEVLQTLLNRSRSGREVMLAELWRHWNQVLGPSLSGLALPLGHRQATLLIAAEDNLVMQELSFLAPEILDRVNAFLDEPLFNEVRFSLLGKQRPLNAGSQTGLPREALPVISTPSPEHLGALWESMTPDTPLGRCYRAYVKRFAAKKRA